jgi:LuxR family maltose regulon positive regulatory protein
MIGLDWRSWRGEMTTQSPIRAEEMPLLRTKLHSPPLRRRYVSRPRLIERLNAGLQRKLTLVSAPVGCGKTTLVSEWVAHLRADPPLVAMGRAPPPLACAWLSLDESDNDPTRFLAYLVAALQTIEERNESAGHIGQGALSALQSPQPPPIEVVLTALINEIATLPLRILLVLDDYHVIEAQPVHDALTFLLQHCPPQMHLVIVSREDPLLPVARLRARNQLTEVRATDLRFTSPEAVAFLNTVMGLDLSLEEIAALERRTEGWIAGLQLAALALQGSLMQGRQDTASLIESFAGSHRFVLDYLIEEVLEQQPESVEAFLLETAILDRLTGPLCDAVRFGVAETPGRSAEHAVRLGSARQLQPGDAGSLTGQDSSQTILETLEHANLFIVPLDEERRWYRYHQLFADLLRQRLRQIRPEQVPTLHIRASEWYGQNGFAAEAIEHAMRAEAFERAALLIEEHADATWRRGEHGKLGRWLSQLPVDRVLSRPQLCIFSAWYLFAIGQRDRAERVLRVAEDALGPTTDRAPETPPPGQGRRPGPDSKTLRGRLAAIRALMGTWWGDGSEIIEHARQALEYLPKQDPWRGPAAIALGDAYDFRGDLQAAYQARREAADICKAAGDIYFCSIAHLKVAITLRAQGRLRETIEICQQQVQLASERGLSQTPVVGCLLAQWGEALAERDDLEGALHRAKRGVELTEGGDLALLGFSNLCLTRVLASRGDLAAAEHVIQKLETLAQRHDLPPFITDPIAAWRATMWLIQGKLETARHWARERALDTSEGSALEHKVEHVVLARILLAQGALDEAARRLQVLLDAAEAGGRVSEAIELLNLQALALQARGDTVRAMAALERALALAEPGGFIRIFVDEGPPMAHLLYEAVSRGIAPDYAGRLLAAFPVTGPEGSGPPEPQASHSALVEPLSERELQVLQLIAKGLTNPEIASRLFLALNTVKAHTRNIYGKLGVHSRTQAAARARALGILAAT